MLTGITDRKVQCVCIHVCQIIRNRGPGPYNSLRHADSRKYFSGLSLMQNQREAHMFYLAREVGKNWWCSSWEKGNLSWLMSSNTVKPEKFDHLHLFYHFTVPLRIEFHTPACRISCTKQWTVSFYSLGS